jgi:hypothetical protein
LINTTSGSLNQAKIPIEVKESLFLKENLILFLPSINYILKIKHLFFNNISILYYIEIENLILGAMY